MSAIAYLKEKLAGRHNVISHIWQSGANYTQRATALLISMVLARLLTPENFGQFAYANAYIHLAFIPVNIGFDQILVSKNQNKNSYSLVMTTAYLLTILRIAIVMGLTGWLLYSGKRLTAELCFLCGLPHTITPIVNSIRCNLEGNGNFRQNMEGVVYSQGLSFFAVVTAVLSGLGVYSLCFIPWITTFSRIIVYWRYIKYRIFPQPTLNGLQAILTHGLGLWMSNAAQVGINRIDKWFVGTHAGSEELGYYNRAFNWSPISQMFLMSLSTNPSVAALSNMKTVRQQAIYLKKIAGITMGAGLLNFIFWRLGAEYFVVLLFGGQWTGTINIFKAYALLSFCMAFRAIPKAACLAFRLYIYTGIACVMCFVILFLFLLFLSNSQFFSVEPLAKPPATLRLTACVAGRFVK